MDAVDGGLLKRFAAERSEAAFEEIVRRHGRMVLGVCERLLGNRDDAEDAFQATFLVLARNAAKLRKSDSVASWLHGAALRVGLNARRQSASRREHERRAAEMTTTESAVAWRELGPVLDEELGRLPERLRGPVVLCYLESKSTEEAARELGWTHGTLRGRLAKGRDLLRRRLSRKGIVVGAAVLAAAVSENASAASVPPACIASTVHAAMAGAAGGALASAGVSAGAASLAEAAVRAMFWAKVKLAAAAVVAGSGVLFGSALGTRALLRGREPRPVEGREGAVAVAPAGPEETGRRGAREKTAAVPEALPPALPKERAASPGAAQVTERDAGPEDVAEVDPPPAAERLPKPVLRSLRALMPGAKIADAERSARRGRTVYEVELDLGGREARVELDAEGAVLEAKEELDVAALPQAVADAIARLYPQATVNEAEKETRDGRTLFDVEIGVDGEDIDVVFTPEGQLVEGEDDNEDGDEDEGGDEGGDEGEDEGERGDNVKANAPPASEGEGAGADVF